MPMAQSALCSGRLCTPTLDCTVYVASSGQPWRTFSQRQRECAGRSRRARCSAPAADDTKPRFRPGGCLRPLSWKPERLSSPSAASEATRRGRRWTKPCQPCTYSSVCNRFIGVKRSTEFRLLAESRAVTQGFVLIQMDRNVTFMHEKTPTDTGVCVQHRNCSPNQKQTHVARVADITTVALLLPVS